MEAERRGELGGPDRGLDSDDFGAGPNSYLEQDGSDEITYVLQQKAAEEGTAAPVSSRQEPGEARNGVGSAAGRGGTTGESGGAQHERDRAEERQPQSEPAGTRTGGAQSLELAASQQDNGSGRKVTGI